jgi:hypothetical protein
VFLEIGCRRVIFCNATAHPNSAGVAVGCRNPIRTQRRPSQTGYDQPPSMLLFVIYACLRLFLALALAPLRDRAADQAGLLVLRHQVRVLERHVKVARWRQAYRLVLAALARRLPRPCWTALLVKPENGAPLAPRAGPKEVGDLRACNLTWELTELGLRPRS